MRKSERARCGSRQQLHRALVVPVAAVPQRDAGELAGPFEAVEVVVVAVVALLDEAGVAAHAELLAEPREAARDAGVDLGQQVALALAGAQQAEAAGH